MVAERLHIDVESFSQKSLPKVGIHAYTEEPSTEIMVLCFAVGEDAVSTWVPRLRIPDILREQMEQYHDEQGGQFYVQTTCPAVIVDHIASGGECAAHNAEFEITMLNGRPGQEIGFPKTPASQWICTMAKAANSAMPRGLGKCAEALGSNHMKNETSRSQMMQLAKPRKPSKKNPDKWWSIWKYPDKYYELYTYCCDDVEAERAVDHMTPDLSPAERQVYKFDQMVNRRGIYVDVPGLLEATEVRNAYKVKLDSACRRISGFGPDQTGALAQWIRDQGIKLDNLQAETIRDILKTELPPKIRTLLQIRQTYAMKAVAKYDSMARALCADLRLRGMFTYYGANTGRWSGSIAQLQNLYRPVIDDPETAVHAMNQGLEWIETLYDTNPMRVLASCVRSYLTAGPGKELIVADFSSIEGRVIAWFAGQTDKLQMFADHGMAYEYTGAKVYGLPFEDLDFLRTMKKTHPDERFAGKTSELALGFQGGHMALQKMARKEGIELDDDFATQLKWDWRDANDMIVQLWDNLELFAKAAVQNPGSTYETNKLTFKVIGKWLYMRLPSGRRLAYYRPMVIDGELTYEGVDTYTRQWKRVKTYGGRLAENAVQAYARDLLVSAMFNLEKAGYTVIGHVHDEAICEVNKGWGSLEEAYELMCDLPKHAAGLPVSADGWRGYRYRK